MKFSMMSPISLRRRPVRLALTILSLVLANALVFAQQEKNANAATTPKATASQKPTASPKPSPTPETKIDAKTEAELREAEDRFLMAIEKRDTGALSEILADYYADSYGGRKKALAKSGVLTRARAGKLASYKIEKDSRLSVSVQTYFVDGKAREKSQVESDEPIEEKWVQVRRVWTKKDGRWLLIAQMATKADPDDKKKETEAEASKK